MGDYRLIVCIVDATGRRKLPEQFQLCLAVRIHRMVVIEVVSGQIGEYANINRQAIESPLIQCMTGGLNRHTLDPVITPLPQLAVSARQSGVVLRVSTGC